MKLLKIINIAHILGLIWIISIVIFLGLSFYARPASGIYTDSQTVLFVTIAITGVLAFLGASLFYIVHILFFRKKKRVKTRGKAKKGFNPLFVAVPLIILGFAGVVAVQGAYNLEKADEHFEAGQSISPKETDAQSPGTSEATKYVDADPVISCTSSHPQCEGQSIQVKQSACSNIYCCQVGDKWNVYPSEDACNAARGSQSNLVQCYVYGQTLSLTPEDCVYYQKSDAVLRPIDDYTGIINTPQPTHSQSGDYAAQNQKNIELRSQCQGNVASYYQQQQTNILSRKDLGESSKQNLLNSNKNQWEQAAKDCEAQYPVY